MENIKEHLTEYIILFIALFIFLVLFIVFRFDRSAQTIISGAGSIFYILWGIIHHAIRERISRTIVWEYVLFGLLIFLLFYTVLSF